MIDRPGGDRQLDLLVRAANRLDPSRIPPKIRPEVASLLKLLMAEHITADVALPGEAADE
jgi:hypothetical protein